MFDPQSIALVLGGVLIATLLQAGLRDCGVCLGEICALLRSGFDQKRARSELAQQISQISRDGLIRTEPRVTGDLELDEATDAMLRDRSLHSLLERHRKLRATRIEKVTVAQRVLSQAAELSPLLGLAGTLLSLGRLASIPDDGEGVAAAIGMAVTTTFYGVVLAHFLFVPLAGLIERRARHEDNAREEIFGWLEQKVSEAEPRLAPSQFHWPDRETA